MAPGRVPSEGEYRGRVVTVPEGPETGGVQSNGAERVYERRTPDQKRAKHVETTDSGATPPEVWSRCEDQITTAEGL
jgi:hypothetical protein